MAKERKIPLRKCSGCGEMKPKTELVRVVRSPEGELSMDLTGRKAGRGAYVCRSIDCLRNETEIGYHTEWFFRRIVLSVRDEIVMFPCHKLCYVFSSGTQCVIRGNCDQNGSAVAQMTFGCHGYGAVGNAVREFGEGIAGAGSNNKNIKKLFRSCRLNF